MSSIMRTLWRPAVALGVALALAGGCSDDSNPEPGPQVFTGGSAGVSAGSSGAGGSVAGTGGASGTSGQAGVAGTTGGTDAGGAAGTTAGSAGTDGGAAGTTGGAAGTTGGSAGATGGSAGAGGQVNCDGPNGCYACKPTTLPQFLNHCTDSTCVPFDNAARLPLYKNGTLPPLP